MLAGDVAAVGGWRRRRLLPCNAVSTAAAAGSLSLISRTTFRFCFASSKRFSCVSQTVFRLPNWTVASAVECVWAKSPPVVKATDGFCDTSMELVEKLSRTPMELES